MIKIAIAGASGRMGTAIQKLAQKDKNFHIAGLLESKNNPLLGESVGGVKVTADPAAAVKDCDALIDFTAPASTLVNAAAAAAAGKAVVIGTTGIDPKQKEELAKVLKPVAAVMAPNMSLSANLLFDVVEKLAAALPGFDAEVIEIHHNLKKDAPSGTAQRLADSIQRGRGKGKFVYGRQGLTGERAADEIGVHALRGGDVIGDHTVYFIGAGERVELVHRVTTRDAFAAGALVAAHWVVSQKPGLYDMMDVMNIRALFPQYLRA